MKQDEIPDLPAPEPQLLRGPTAEEERDQSQQSLTWLGYTVSAIERWQRIAKPRPQSRSELGDDDRRSSPLQTSHLVTHAGNMAIDALRSLRTLLFVEPGKITLPQIAHHALIRTAIEAAAQGVWLLGPEEQPERLLRMLRVRRAEAFYEYELTATLGRVDTSTLPPGHLREQMIDEAEANKKRALAQLDELVRNNGLDHTTYAAGAPSFRGIVFGASEYAEMDGATGQAIWQMVSGLTHPSSARALSTSKFEATGPIKDGVWNTSMSGTFKDLNTGLLVALKLLLSLNELTTKRKLTPIRRTA